MRPFVGSGAVGSSAYKGAKDLRIKRDQATLARIIRFCARRADLAVAATHVGRIRLGSLQR